MNIVLVSHCDFLGNSAMHVFSIANELQAAGVDCVVCVPNDPETVRSHGVPRFRLLHHQEAVEQTLVFPDGRGPDLVHAWTPREVVRKVTMALSATYGVPYLVHLEDNEEVIVEDEFGGATFAELAALPGGLLDQLIAEHRSHPVRYPEFMRGAAGVTVLMDRLLEFKPEGVPGLVFWAGFDDAFRNVRPDPGVRGRLGIGDDALMAVYTGNVHSSNLGEVRSLVAAVAALRRRGRRLVLVKTGWNHVEVPFFEEGKKQGLIVDLGFCARDEVPRLVAAADVLVQPGRAGDFNDYRFPSKLPEFLVSGRPVVLPRTNIGRFLRDGEECVLLDDGHALEIAAKLEPLLGDAALRARIGAGGRAFALRELTWAGNVARIKRFYEGVLGLAPLSEQGAAEQRPVRETVRSAAGPQAGRTRLPHSQSDRDWWTRLIAFYLPQFHRIRENDEWWGEGFTEWTNVRRARPNYRGHDQPVLPSDLGFYDLADPKVLDRQADLARAYGIHGFCYYYYWFNGQRLLELPIDQMLARGRPDFPFCLCWANENWSRRWDGSEDEILMRQDYADGYAERFIRDVIPALRDPRYIRVGDAPLLLVYRADQLPDAAEAVRVWRRVSAEEGIGSLHLAAVQSFGITDPRPYGFDAAVDFPPHVQHALLDVSAVPGAVPGFSGYFEDYLEVAKQQVVQPAPPYLRYRGVMPAWDNTPRRLKRAHVCVKATPEAYRGWLERLVEQAMSRSPVQEPLLFINAWNEWAEGAYLEPDRRLGRARLEATRSGLCRGTAAWFVHRGIPVNEVMVEHALVAEGVLAPKGGEP